LGLARLFLGFKTSAHFFKVVGPVLAQKNWVLAHFGKSVLAQKTAIFESISPLFKNAETVAITGFEALLLIF